jgi:hypothetical protein
MIIVNSPKTAPEIQLWGRRQLEPIDSELLLFIHFFPEQFNDGLIG